MAPKLEFLARFVPQFVVRQLATNSAPLTAPRTEQFQAAVLFADIQGFTALTEVFIQRGPGGVEELSHHINSYFGQLINLCDDHGGEVVAFAGDAPIVIWSLDHGRTPGGDQENLHTVCLRATQCALALQRRLNNYEVVEAGQRFALRIGIGAGNLLAVSAGGTCGHWEFLVAGDALEQSCLSKGQAAPGDVILSPKAEAITQGRFVGDCMSAGFLRVKDLRVPLPLRASIPIKLPTTVEAALRGYIPDALLSRMDAEQTSWVAELRRVTVVFVNISGLDYADVGATALIQRVVQELQEILVGYEGCINQVIVDDKGTNLVAAFGLPFFTHEDDATRGTKAALEIGKKLAELGLGSRIGVATGSVFCGGRGNALRQEYAMIGATVNLAARLMEAAESEPLCDAATNQGAKARLSFDILSPLTVRGKREQISVFRVSDQPLPKPRFRPMVGRTIEQETLLASLNALGQGFGKLVLIEGGPGMGKSRLIADLLERTTSANVKTLLGSGDTIETSRPYHGWRGVFQQYFGIKDTADPAGLRQNLLIRLQADPDLWRLAPLLNVVLPLNLPDNEITAQMEGQVRADNTNELLVRLLKQAAHVEPLVIILEDAHWLDSASWTTATHLVSRAVQPLLLVVVTRPIPEPVPPAFQELLQQPTVKRLQLKALTPDDIHTLLRQQLGVSRVSRPVLDLVERLAQGNPFYSEELASGFQEAELIHTKEGICQLTPGAVLGNAIIPDTVQGVIRGRIDRLTTQQQLVLKVGSVIGRVFAYRVLHDIYPLLFDKVHLLNYLNDLQRLDFTRLDSPEPNLAYFFKHILTQEVAYSLFLFEQRRDFHSAVAEWYETNQLDTTGSYPLLAHHWAKAEVAGKAIHYLEKAGDQALSSGAYREALLFFDEALTWEKRQKSDSDLEEDRQRRGRLERQLGEAYLGLGNHIEGQGHIHRALAQLGWPAPPMRRRLVAVLIKQIALQVLHRLWPGKFVGSSLAHGDARIEGARAYIRLVETYWFANETFPLVHAGISALNLAEAAGPSPELARAYAIMCLATGSVSLHRLAERYARQAVETAQKVDQLFPLAYALFITSVYRIGAGKLDQIEDNLDQAAAIFDRIGDRRLLGDALTVLGMSALYHGEFLLSAKQFSDMFSAGERNQNYQHQMWGLIGKAESVLRLGQVNEALSLLESALSLLKESPDRAEELRTQGLMAVAYLRLGNYSLAEDHAKRAADLISQFSMPTAHYLLEGYGGAAEVYLALWERSQHRPSFERRDLVKSVKRACRALRLYSRVFAIGEPRFWLCNGLAHWLRGHPRRAHRSWAKSLAVGERLGMLYEQRLAHDMIKSRAIS